MDSSWLFSCTTGPKRLIKEPSWHRRARRERTEARTLLRTFLSGGASSSAAIFAAAQTLRSHHSASVLPARALSRLQQQASNMSQRTPWQCTCGQRVKASASFCGQCGGPWDAATSHSQGWQHNHAYTTEQGQPPWHQSWWPSQPASPRRRADTAWRPQSPRRRPKGQPGKGKGKKGAGKDSAAPPGVSPAQPLEAPSLSGLPTPPAVKAPARTITAATPASQTSTPVEEKRLLAEVLANIPADQLPPELQRKLGQYQVESTHQQGRHMHRLVSEKSAAPQGAGAATRRSFRLQCSLGGLCATASGALVQARRVPLGGNDGLRRTGGRLVGQTSQRDASTCVGGQRWPRSQRPLHCGRRHGRRRGLGGHGCDCSGGGSRNPGEEPEVPGPDPGAQRAHSGITPASASRSRGRRRGDQSQGWQPDSPQTAKQRRCQRQRRGHGWRRFTAALYTCGQGWHQEAPWIGLPSSLGVLGGPIGLRHSVMDEGDFTCSLWAAVLAANLEMEVKLGDRSLDNFMTFAEDLRITSISSVDSCGNECLQPGIYAGPDFDAEDFSYLLEPATVQFPLEDEPLCTYNCTGDVVHTIASHQSQGVACMRSRIPFHFALREGIGKLLPSISLVGSLHRLVVAPGAPGRRPSSLSCLAAAWLPAPRPSLQHCSVCGLLPAPRSPALASLTGGPCNQHLSLLPGLPTRIPRADLFPLLRPLYTFCLRTSMEILRGTFACLSTHGSLASGPLGE